MLPEATYFSTKQWHRLLLYDSKTNLAFCFLSMLARWLKTHFSESIVLKELESNIFI